MKKLKIGFAMTGSFCTFDKAIEELKILKADGHDIIPIMSQCAYNTDTRFGTAEHFREELKKICQTSIISSIAQAEPIGPKKLLDILVIEPCTGNTLAKLANGIADTPVTLAAKSHLRNGRPILIAVSTNDALAGAAKNIGHLMNYKNIYFIPINQDDCINKPTSVIADFTKTEKAIASAINGKQLQPIIYPKSDENYS